MYELAMLMKEVVLQVICLCTLSRGYLLMIHLFVQIESWLLIDDPPVCAD